MSGAATDWREEGVTPPDCAGDGCEEYGTVRVTPRDEKTRWYCRRCLDEEASTDD